MSVDCADGEPCSVFRHNVRRARKEHRCSACNETIERGHLYSYTYLVFDGDSDTIKRCMRCETIYRHLLKVETDEDYTIDLELKCGHTYESRHGALPEEIARLAFLTPAEAQALARKP